MIQVRLFTDNFYILDDGRVRQFLIVGEKKALLVDTGFPDSHVYELSLIQISAPARH